MTWHVRTLCYGRCLASRRMQSHSGTEFQPNPCGSAYTGSWPYLPSSILHKSPGKRHWVVASTPSSFWAKLYLSELSFFCKVRRQCLRPFMQGSNELTCGERLAELPHQHTGIKLSLLHKQCPMYLSRMKYFLLSPANVFLFDILKYIHFHICLHLHFFLQVKIIIIIIIAMNQNI